MASAILPVHCQTSRLEPRVFAACAPAAKISGALRLLAFPFSTEKAKRGVQSPTNSAKNRRGMPDRVSPFVFILKLHDSNPEVLPRVRPRQKSPERFVCSRSLSAPKRRSAGFRIPLTPPKTEEDAGHPLLFLANLRRRGSMGARPDRATLARNGYPLSTLVRRSLLQ